MIGISHPSFLINLLLLVTSMLGIEIAG